VAQDAAATVAYAPRAEVVDAMVARGVTALTGVADAAAAWRTLVSTQDVVGLKVYSLPGATGGTRPAVAAAVARGLLAAGLPATNIVIWDRRLRDLQAAGFGEVAAGLGVRLAGSRDAGYDAEAHYDSGALGALVAGDLEFGRDASLTTGRRSHVSRLVSRELTKIINLAPLLNHNRLGVVGNLYNLALGSVDNALRFETSAGLLSTAVPEIYALPQLSDKVVLSVTDALVGQYEGGRRTLLHYAEALNELRFSRDPVALDALAFDDLNRLRRAAGAGEITNRIELLANALLLELGEPDPIKVDVDYAR
jgi:hypothetical protein